MKTKKSLTRASLMVLLVFGLCLGTASSALSFTTINLDIVDPYVGANGIAGLAFQILEPVAADVSNLTLNLPTGWFNFSGGKEISAFDGMGGNSLVNGVLGTFDVDVLLGSWELTLQNGDILRMGDNLPIEYTVLFDGTDYTITNVVPIPSALLLLGGGLVGLVGIRRKTMK